ncbi:MAG: GNAT family N-acetyltransferase [Bacteroidia bacterium]|nr:GNAT family N-acetyltransferase [Bacteroidia bacterium]
MHLRLANISDIPQILKLVSEVVPFMNADGNLQWDNNYPNKEAFTRDIHLMKLWVAELDGNVAGVSAITTDQDPEYADVGWDLNETAIVTHRLAVSPRYHGKGVAIALMKKAEEEAIRRGIKTLRIDTNSMNKATQNLFPKMGYVFSGEIGLSYRPGLRFFCYEKRLS